MTIWNYKANFQGHTFVAECEDENTAIAVEAHVYKWLAGCGNRRAIRTLKLRRRCEETRVRDRKKMMYGGTSRSSYAYSVYLYFNNDADAVAFKLFIS